MSPFAKKLFVFIGSAALLGAVPVASHAAPIAAPQVMPATENPYWPMANRSLNTVLALPEEQLLNKEPATSAFWLAWGYTSPKSKLRGDAAVLEKCVHLWEVLAERYRTQTKQDNFPGSGFWNHLPLLESLRLLEPVTAIDTAKKAGWKAAVLPQIEDDYQQYGMGTAENWATSAAGDYPNADAQHLAVMYAAYLIYGDEKFKVNAQQFVAAMNKHLRPPGAWLYYRGSTPIPLYHGFEIIFLGRYYQLSKDPAALDQIRRTVDFYPYTYTPEDTVEYTSSPWWKQMWNPMGGPYHAPELVAALTGDARNRWFADLRAKRYFQHYWIAYCGEAWDESNAATAKREPLPDNYIIADASIDGVRGRFGNFSWMGGRGKNIIGFGGVLVADAAQKSGYDGYLQFAHLGITVPGKEGKPYYESLRLIGNPDEPPTPGATAVQKEYAAQAINYIPHLQANPSKNYDDWKVTELWLFTPKGVVASFQAKALKDDPGTLPEGIVRVGPYDRPHALDGRQFYSGNLHGQILTSDFDKIAMADGSGDEHMKDPRAEVRLSSAPAGIRAGQTFGYSVLFSPTAQLPARVEQATENTLRVQLDGVSYQLQYDGDRVLNVTRN